MSPQDFGQTAVEGRRVEPPREARGEADVVGDAGRLQLIQKPHALLRERERRRLRAVSLPRQDGQVRNVHPFFTQQQLKQLALLGRKALKLFSDVAHGLGSLPETC